MLIKRLAIFLIDFYRNYLSNLKINTCKYYPTCSAYTKEAIIKKGTMRGSLMGAWRIVRCNPFSSGGYDPPV